MIQTSQPLVDCMCHVILLWILWNKWKIFSQQIFLHFARVFALEKIYWWNKGHWCFPSKIWQLSLLLPEKVILAYENLLFFKFANRSFSSCKREDKKYIKVAHLYYIEDILLEWCTSKKSDTKMIKTGSTQWHVWPYCNLKSTSSQDKHSIKNWSCKISQSISIMTNISFW